MEQIKDELKPLEKLQKLAEKWGGSITFVPKEKFDAMRGGDVSPAPFCMSLSVRYATKEILIRGDSQFSWAGVVHEIGHVFACRVEPGESDEYEFFGWEFALLRFLDLPIDEWIRNNDNYSVGYGFLFGELTPEKQDDVLEERLQRAIDTGRVTPELEPLSFR